MQKPRLESSDIALSLAFIGAAFLSIFLATSRGDREKWRKDYFIGVSFFILLYLQTLFSTPITIWIIFEVIVVKLNFAGDMRLR